MWGVIVVSKTHLDVGYTDYAKNVLDRYVDSLIRSRGAGVCLTRRTQALVCTTGRT